MSRFLCIVETDVFPLASSEDNAATETIKRLRLDDSELIAEKKVGIDVFLDESLNEEACENFLLNILLKKVLILHHLSRQVKVLSAVEPSLKVAM